MADRRVLSMQPESGFYHKRAMKSIDKEDFVAALRHLRKAIAMEPENVAYRMDLANTYARMGLYERSNLEIELLLHKKSLPTEAFFGLGSNFLALGDYDQAQTMLEAYEQIDPQGAYIDETEEALGYISECDYETELDRELDELSMNGKAALDAGDLEHAVDCLEQALAKDPDMTYARNNLAYAYFCLGNMSLAWKHVRRVLQQDPLDVSGRCNESCFYLAEGKPAQARAALRYLQLEQIEEIDELFKYCLALADLEMDQELLQALKKFFLTSPYDPSMLYLYGAALYNLGRPQESLLALDKLSQTDPDNLLAAFGARMATAKVRGGAAPERLSYTFDFPEELEREVDETLRRLSRDEPGAAARELKQEDVCARVRAGLTGSQEQIRRALRALPLIGGEDAERLLREVLLSPTQSAHVKEKAFAALVDMQAKPPYYSLQDGRLVEMRAMKVKYSAQERVPSAYVRVLEEAMRHMSDRFAESEATKTAVGCWTSYVISLDGHYPKLQNRKAWVLALEGVYRERKGEKVDWPALAEEAGCSPRTLIQRSRRLVEAASRVRAMAFAQNAEDKDKEGK